VIDRNGTIITFYSYKGGTGRSLALANVAWILASSGKQVLVIDWDLEAPGLHWYFRPFLIDAQLSSTPGLVDFIWELASAPLTPSPAGDWLEKVADVSDRTIGIDWEFPNGGILDILPAGRQTTSYAERVNAFDWKNFYARLGGNRLIEALRAHLKREYDYILIDSRTGVSDTSGICTIQLPDKLVACFTLNNQSMQGAVAVLRSVREQSAGRPVEIFPLATRIELAEKDKLEDARSLCRQLFADFVPVDASPAWRSYWHDMEVLYIPYFAYQEVLAVFADRTGTLSSQTTLLAAMEGLARRVVGDDKLAMPDVPEAERRRVLASYFGSDAGTESLEEYFKQNPRMLALDERIRKSFAQWEQSKYKTSKLLARSDLAQLDLADRVRELYRQQATLNDYIVLSREYAKAQGRPYAGIFLFAVVASPFAWIAARRVGLFGAQTELFAAGTLLALLVALVEILAVAAERNGIRRRVFRATLLGIFPHPLRLNKSAPFTGTTPSVPDTQRSAGWLPWSALVSVLLIALVGAFFAMRATRADNAAALADAAARVDARSKDLKALEDKFADQREEVETQQVSFADATAGWKQAVTDFALEKTLFQKVDPDVDWATVQQNIISVPPGRRLTAVLTALKLARRDGGQSLKSDMDTPGFLDHVLSRSGFAAVPISEETKAIDALMSRFRKRMDTPEPGDFMLYDTTMCGERGRKGCFYLAPGNGGHGVCVGLMHRHDVQVIDTASFDRQNCKFIGHFAVPYEETTASSPCQKVQTSRSPGPKKRWPVYKFPELKETGCTVAELTKISLLCKGKRNSVCVEGADANAPTRCEGFVHTDAFVSAGIIAREVPRLPQCDGGCPPTNGCALEQN
jgi:MinD-like ATPase involved in chromosome partitioning or flagellar assembly